MNKIAKQINSEIKQTKEYQEYIDLKDQISKNQYLNDLLGDIKEKQKEMKSFLENKDEINYKKAKSELETLKNEFINHPLINNYLKSKDMLYNLVEQVATIISEE